MSGRGKDRRRGLPDFTDPEFDHVKNFPHLVAVGLNPDRGTVRYAQRRMSNHMLRTIMVGLWLRLENDDRVEFIEELMHYLENEQSSPAGISQIIANFGAAAGDHEPTTWIDTAGEWSDGMGYHPEGR